jgi:hypothetical protein
VGASYREVAAAQVRSSCNAFDGYLESNTPNVLYDNPHFTVGGSKYPLNVFSLAEPAPWALNFMCLRYELHNIGKDAVPLVYWDLLNEWSATDLAADEHVVRTRRRPSVTKDPVRGPTTIRAFRSEEISTTAWQTVEDWQKSIKKAALPNSDARFSIMRSAALDPAAAKAIDNGDIPDGDVVVFDLDNDPFGGPPEVADAIKSSWGSFEASSGPYLGGAASDFTPLSHGVYYRMSIKRKPEVRIEVYAPALFAMEDSRNIVDYIRALKSSRQPIKWITEKGVANYGDLLRGRSQAFLVEHPVTVKWSGLEGSGSICITVASYSPYPVNLGQDYCVR